MLTAEIYDKYLTTIGGKSFTQREVEILTCVVGLSLDSNQIFDGEKTVTEIANKISSILSTAIQPIDQKTVFNALGHIRSKIGCKKTEGLIPFVANSEKFSVIKESYKSIFINDAFKKELTKISQSLKLSIGYLLISTTEQEALTGKKGSKLPRLHRLREDLKILRLMPSSCIIKSPVKRSTDISVLDKINLADNTKIVSCLSKKFIEDSYLRLSSNQDVEEQLPPIQSLLNLEYFDVNDDGNYYFRIFEVVKKLLHGKNIDEHIQSFKKEYEKICKMDIASPIDDKNKSNYSVSEK